jgi:L-aspartate oxidase
MEIRTDFLVIGSGIAGLSFAIKAADYGSVAIVTKRERAESATNYAQGGIASVFAETDSFEAHTHDTLEAGAGLCHEDTVEMVVRDGPERIRELVTWGARFSMREDMEGAEFDLGIEGGHSNRRIVHASDITGREIERALIEMAERKGNVRFYEGHVAVDLITHHKFFGRDGNRCYGAYVLDNAAKEIHTLIAPVTLLATGGAGKVYLYTSNPDVATGDGIAMAYRAGARIANMEFIQFHPTCLFHPEAKSFLISEAVRGEGGILRLRDGTTFMKRYHRMADLAPRDIVARAIDTEMKKSGDDCVYLDITHKDAGFIRERFPNIYERCLSFGFDMARDPIPVVPAAHYTCGGVVTDKDGRTGIEGLYACGEAACTGLHGANRLASNSLLEGAVFAHRAFLSAVSEIKKAVLIPSIPPWELRGAVESDEMVVVSQNWDEIRRFMWNYVGIVRSDRRLERAKRRIELIQDEITDYYWNFKLTGDLVELRNIATVAELIIRCAMMRKESRGLHCNIDYPKKDDVNWKKDTIIER